MTSVFYWDLLRFQQWTCCLFERCGEVWNGCVGVGVGGLTERYVIAAGKTGLVNHWKACDGG
jgi:hypothetical protein